MTRNLKIIPGGMYQEWSYLIDLVDIETAKSLEMLANTKGWREIHSSEALNMGFNELVEWSQPETDILVLVDENYLVCLLKKDYPF